MKKKDTYTTDRERFPCDYETMLDHIPLNVYDANGILILRSIIRFNCNTGEVESFVLDNYGGNVVEDGVFKKRIETYPAPLIWKTISYAEVERCRPQLWDLKEDNS